MKKFGLSIALLCFLAGLILAHPHIRKTVGASAQGVQLKLSYFTLPYNAEHMADVEEGFVFHCGRATLEISGEIESSGVKVSTGQYDVRAKALTADEWTLLLIPKAPEGSEGQQEPGREISLESRSMKGAALGPPSEPGLDQRSWQHRRETDSLGGVRTQNGRGDPLSSHSGSLSQPN